MKKHVLIIVLAATLVLTLGLISALAGNRADINSDRAVNATDLATLTNILAGNIDVSNYNLANVVVVAPQGGDFTDPCDAADWVRSQPVNPEKRYVILITPGRYYLNRTLVMPSNTCLKGYGPMETFLIRNSSAATYPFGAAISFTGVDSTVDSIRVNNDKADDTPGNNMAGIFIRNSYARIRNCHVIAIGCSVDTSGIYTMTDSGATIHTSLIVENSNIYGQGETSSTGEAFGLSLNQAQYTEVTNSKIAGYCKNPTSWGTAIYKNNVGLTSTDLIVNHSALYSTSVTSGQNYYFWLNGAAGTTMFEYCQLRGNCNTSTLITRLFCHNGAAVLPNLP